MQRIFGYLSVGLRGFWLAAYVATMATASSAGAEWSPPLRIDLGMSTGRNDTAADGWVEWQVADGPAASRRFDDITVTLRAASGSQLRGVWHKAGLAAGALMATDGIVGERTDDDGVIEITLEGLVPGPHSLVTYHNWLDARDGGPLTASVAGTSVDAQVRPSHRSSNDVDAGSAYLEFSAPADGRAIIRISAGAGGGGRAILNGLEIDAVDPRAKATMPTPAQRDGHVAAEEGQVRLQWRAAAGAVKHELYAISDADFAAAAATVASADQQSPAYRGTVDAGHATLAVPPHDSLIHHCWRIDSIDREGRVTRGDVWSFRVRHLAFPGAEGYGRFAVGGRGGRVIKVTTLADAGPGSLRAAIEANEPRTIVFDVSGRIILKTRTGIRNPYITIAGQTAPGVGVCISNYNLGMLGCHDAVIRYLRVRPGDTSGETLDGMGMASSDHAIIDHCSISWTQDEAFSSRGARNVTLQRTLISEALNIAGHKKYEKGKQHGYAASISGDVGSFHHNLLAHCAGRNWSLAGGLDKAGRHAGRLDIRNNVVYNWSHRTTDGGVRQANFVNNYYRPGPASQVFHVLMSEREAVGAFGPQDYYVDGNVMEGHYGADEPTAGVISKPKEPLSSFLASKPFFESFVATSSAAEALEDVLADVGCNVPALDPHDTRILRETRDGTTTFQGSISGLPGLPDSQSDVGGWDDYPEVHRAADWDSDDDGMPNAWETAHGFDPHSPAGDFSEANADPDGDGFTNLEDYLNSLVRPRPAGA